MLKNTILLFTVILLLGTPAAALAGTAELQVIHNAADPSAAVVDVYVNSDLVLDDFTFRAATPFVEVPAGVNLNIGVAPSSSAGPGDIIADFDVMLEEGYRYVAIANGLLSLTEFTANPDERNIAFSLFLQSDIRSRAPAKRVKFVGFHGATDAPTVDIVARSDGKKRRLINNLTYGEFSPYRNVAPEHYVLDVTTSKNNSPVVVSYEADLSSLGGGTAVVFASGFLSPNDNQNGPAFGLFVVLPDGQVVELPVAGSKSIKSTMGSGTAELQVIHNAADPNAAVVDIYVNESLLLDDFAFRAATPFVEVPAGVNLNIGVAPGSSTGPGDVIADFDVMLEGGKRYVAIANGVLDASGFAPNPDGRDISFKLLAQDGIRNRGFFGLITVIAFHGATDAPTVDILAQGSWFGWKLVNDLTYGEFSSYKILLPTNYLISVTPGGDNSTVVATYEADLSGLRNGSAVVFASGFLSPADNQNGPAFGLFAALPNGQVVEFPPVMQTAELQVIHNAADPNAAVVDVYVNDGLLLDDFAFRTATPFVEVPASVNLNIGVAPGSSTGPSDVIADFDVTLEQGERYVAVANGVLNPDDFQANPDGKSIGFSLYPQDGIRERGYFGFVKVIGFHGATDAPTVDIVARGSRRWRTRFDDLTYGEFSPYRTLFPTRYLLDVTPGDDNSTIVATFEADLSSLRNGAAVVFASGFLSPPDNQNGPAFGLFGALPDGQVVEFPQVTTARLQVIHNAADPAAEVVDVYVNGDLFLDDFAFRTATPYVDVPAGVNLNIGVAPGNSSGPGDVIADFDVTLVPGKTYVAMANGVLNPDDFQANPDGIGIGFALYPRDGMRESSKWDRVNIIAFHGATDAPTVDILNANSAWHWPLFNDLSYGEFTSYRHLKAKSYTLAVTPGNDNSTVVASFVADLSGLANGAAVVFASGFLTPDDDQNGAAFGLFAALPDGQVIALPLAKGNQAQAQAKELSDETASLPTAFMLNQNYPNPFNPETTISFALPTTSQVTVKVYNSLGQLVTTLVQGQLEAGTHEVRLNASGLASGMYFYQMQAGSFKQVKKMMLLK
jgi:hypothetical protein